MAAIVRRCEAKPSTMRCADCWSCLKQTPDSQRLFFALWPEDALRATLDRRVRELTPGRGRAVTRENLHLTLAFLGNTATDMRVCLERAADAIRIPRFDLTLDRTGYFSRARVYWLGASQIPAALTDLVAALNAAQRQCGGDPEPRPFRAHLTLARKVRRQPPPADPAPLHWPVERFALVSSRTFPEGPLYRLERTWMLQSQ